MATSPCSTTNTKYLFIFVRFSKFLFEVVFWIKLIKMMKGNRIKKYVFTDKRI